MDRLDADAIRTLSGLEELEVRVLARCGSTNTELLAADAPGPLLLAAEAQSAGRGRRGRRWHSAPGRSATFSIRRRMRCAPAALAGLSLAVGVAAARALRALGAAEVALKWPNDLVARGAKLGGILVESRAAADGGTAVVAGIGVNCHADPALARLGRPAIALDALLAPAPSRNAVIAAIAREAMPTLAHFEHAGLAPFVAEWRALHAYEGARLRVRIAGGRILSGRACGIGAGGALLLATARGLREIVCGRLLEIGP